MRIKANSTATKDEAKAALVPKLRFPEFRGTKRWDYQPLGTLLIESPDYGVNAAAVPFTELLPQYLRITDISDDGTYLSDKRVSVNLEPTAKVYLDEGDIVLARTGASVGKSYRYRKEDGRLVFAGFLIRVKPNPKRLVSVYLANFLTTEQYWKWVAATSARSGQPGINSVEYSSLAIPLPTIFAEQQKIAECLSSMDELMAAQARKVDALKTHKKGLMQQLFPRAGETRPRLRFPEFQNAAEWTEKPLGKVAENLDNRRVPITSGDRKAGDVPYYGASGVVDYVEGFIFDEDLLCVSEDGANLVARTYPIAFPISGKTWVNNHAHVLKFENACTQKFVEVYLNSIKLDDFITGMAQPKLNRAMLDRIPIPHPGVPEQQRIATCLNSLDALITAETQKLEALNLHKRGLMQQLFPSPEEAKA